MTEKLLFFYYIVTHLNYLQDSELVKLLQDARNCVNILNENLTLFVKVILVRLFKITFMDSYL
jgi:hypothetical protein